MAGRWLRRVAITATVERSSAGQAGLLSAVACVARAVAARATTELALSLPGSSAFAQARIDKALADPQAAFEAARLMLEEIERVNGVLRRASEAAGQVVTSSGLFQAKRRQAAEWAHDRFDQAHAQGVLIHDALRQVMATGEPTNAHEPLETALSSFAGQIRAAAAVATYRSTYGGATIFSGTNRLAYLSAEVTDARTAADRLIASAAFIDAGVRARGEAGAAGAGTVWPAPVPRAGQLMSSGSTLNRLELVGSIADDLRKQLDHSAGLTNEVIEGLMSRLAHYPGEPTVGQRVSAAVVTLGASEVFAPKAPVNSQQAVPQLRECYVAAGFASLALREVMEAAAAASAAKDLGAALRHLGHAAEQATVAQKWGAAHDDLLNRVAPIAADAREEAARPRSWAPRLAAAIDALIVAAAEGMLREPAWAGLVRAVAAAVDEVTGVAST